MIFDLVGKHFRALLHSEDIGREVLNSGGSLRKLTTFKTILGILHTVLWLSFPATLIFVHKMGKGFAVFEGVKRLALYTVSAVIGLAFLDLLLLMITGTFSLSNVIRFILALLGLMGRLGMAPESGDPDLLLDQPGLPGVFGGVLTTVMTLQYGVSMGFVIFSFAAYIFASKTSASGGRNKMAVFLLNWSLIFLVSLYSWHLVFACITGSICMPINDPSIDHNMEIQLEDKPVNISIQQFLKTIRTCAETGKLDTALLAAARLKNSPLTIGYITADPSSNTLSVSGMNITNVVGKVDLDCQEFGNAGIAAMNETCTGLLGTFDTMHSGVAMVFICSAVVFVMMLVSFWYGNKETKNASATVMTPKVKF